MSLSQIELENLTSKSLEELKLFYSGPDYKDIIANRLQENPPDSTKAAKRVIFVHFAKLLRDKHPLHWLYDLNKLPEDTVWEPMKKLVTAVRVNELKEVKVMRRKGKYQVRQLKSTYFGKMIFQELEELESKSSLKEIEYNKVKLVCKKLNLSLPEVIEPTTTELFFGDDEGE